MSEIDWDARYAERETEERAKFRQFLATAGPAHLGNYNAMIEAIDAEAAAKKAKIAATTAYVNGLAEAAGVKIGSRVTRTRLIGYRDKKEQTQTFEVTRISLGYKHDSLHLFGKTILKTGGIGGLCDIGTDWKLVKEPPTE